MVGWWITSRSGWLLELLTELIIIRVGDSSKREVLSWAAEEKILHDIAPLNFAIIHHYYLRGGRDLHGVAPLVQLSEPRHF